MVDKWGERLERRPLSTGTIIVIYVIAAVLLIGAAIWVISVLVSPARGTGNAYAAKNSANNFIEQQALFVSRNEDYRVKLVQIKDAQNMVKAEISAPQPTDGLAAYEAQRQLSNDHATVQQFVVSCQRDATEYNTAGQLYLAQDFKNAGLPYRLDYAACSAS